MTFKLPKLNFAFDALEPHIDALTMEIHYSKHHAGYTNKLNSAIEGTDLKNKNIEEILSAGILSTAIRNNGGGFYNHCLFWDILSPNKSMPSNTFLKVIERDFSSFASFKEVFTNAASSRFGSGWAWLCAKSGKLEVCSTPNQDNPLMKGIGCDGTPILCLDVWEHAYYLNYQNRRPDYINAFFNVIDWSKVEDKFNNA
jgi:Fe-Mn family superoxide dismutase